MGFTVKGGSQKGFWEGGFQKVPRTPPLESTPLRRSPYKTPTFVVFFQGPPLNLQGVWIFTQTQQKARVSHKTRNPRKK